MSNDEVDILQDELNKDEEFRQKMHELCEVVRICIWDKISPDNPTRTAGFVPILNDGKTTDEGGISFHRPGRTNSLLENVTLRKENEELKTETALLKLKIKKLETVISSGVALP